MKNLNTIVVANTKGGAGKSMISLHFLPMLFLDKKINVHEIDDSNMSRLKNSSLNFENLKVEENQNALVGIDYDISTGTDEINIIDCGGGTETKMILNSINHNSELNGLTYFIPTNDDITEFDNVKETIKLIKENDDNAKIYIIFNRCLKMTENDIKEQFLGFFGDKDYGIDARYNEIEKDIIDIFYVRTNKILNILSSKYHISLKDGYLEYQKINNIFADYKKEWLKNEKEEYKKQYDSFLSFRRFFEIGNTVIECFSNLKREKNGK